MEVRAAFSFILALFLAMALIPALVHVAGPAGLLDVGGGRKAHAGAVPRIGGVAIFFGFLIPTLIWVPLQADVSALLLATAVLFVHGLLDDRFNLDYRVKLLGQALAAVLFMLAGGALFQQLPPWLGGTLPEWLAIPFTLLVLVALTNAVNLSDGLDGLAGGVSLLATVGLLLILSEGEDPMMLIVLATLLGAILGFLRFNSFPARLFMGDAGSQFLGFSTAALAITVTQQSDLSLSPTLPVLLLGLPILDTLTVMAGRIVRGRSPFEADRTHLHHRLLAVGLSQKEAVALIYGGQFGLIIMAYLLRDRADALILSTYGVFCFLTLVGLWALERYHDHPPQIERLAQARFWLRRLRALRAVPFQILYLGVPVFLVLGALATTSVSPDVGVLALVLSLVLSTVLVVLRLPFFALERLVAYTTAITVLYQLAQAPGLAAACNLCVPAFCLVVALSSLIWARALSAGFSVSTLDLLILLAALVAPLLRGLGLQDLGVLVLEALVLFYAIEILLQEHERRWDMLRIGVLAALAILAFRGLTA